MLSELNIARIENSQGRICGAGFVISDRYVMTCAHVVCYALSIDVKTLEPPSGEIYFKLPLIDDNEEYRAKVVNRAWYAVESNQELEDIAVLEVIEEYRAKLSAIRSEERIASFQDSKELGNRFRAFGFPTGAEHTGSWARGDIVGKAVGCLVQVQGNSNDGQRIEPGFSGTAIWNKNLDAIIGMAVRQKPRDPRSKIGFMIPSEYLVKAWPPLEEIYIESTQHINEIKKIIEEYNDCFERDFHSSYSIILGNAISNKEKKYSIFQKLKDLLQHPKANKFSKLEQLVGYLFLQEERSQNVNSELSNKLKDWLDKYSRTDDLIEFVRKTYLKEENDNFLTALIIKITKLTNSYSTSAWLINDLNSYLKEGEKNGKAEPIKGIDETKTLTQDKITEITKIILEKATSLIRNYPCRIKEIKRIYFCIPPLSTLPKNINICALDFWLVHEEIHGLESRLGEDYEVILSLLDDRESLGPKQLIRWENNSRALREDLLKSALDTVHEFDHESHDFDKQLKKGKEGKNIIALRLEKALAESEEKSELMFESCMHFGIPFIIWTRKNIDQDNSKLALHSLCNNRTADELPQAIRCSRMEGYSDPNSLGSHVSILWDDYELFIPTTQNKFPK